MLWCTYLIPQYIRNKLLLRYNYIPQDCLITSGYSSGWVKAINFDSYSSLQDMYKTVIWAESAQTVSCIFVNLYTVTESELDHT